MLLDEIFTNLQSRWQKAWWLRFFTKSTALGRLLDLKEKPNSFELVQTYLSSSWWNRLWFRSFLAWEELCRFYDIMNVTIFLKNENLLNKDNLNTLEVRISDQELISSRFDRGLVYLGYSGYLDRFKYEATYYEQFDNFSLGSLVPGLKSLKFANILNQENFEAITKKKINTKCHVEALSILNSADILTHDNRELIATHVLPARLAYALSFLQHSGILTSDNRQFVAYHSQPIGMSKALRILNSAGILTTEYREFVAGHSQPDDFAAALSILERSGMLTPQNLRRLADSRKLLTEDAWEIVWDRIPFHYLTQANINRLFEAARYHNGDAPHNNHDVNARLRRAVDIIFEQHIPPARVAAFNNGQSTHTASVHQTVSQSAVNLLNAYGSHLALETTIANIKRYLQGLDNSLKNAAAKRCIERITAIDYTFSDRTSDVSIRQLLALAWLAIHDRKKCTASREDGLAFLIDGLYEIQRGYNLNEHGEDDEMNDGSICHAGTFNKLIEKLNGIHQDVAVYYITHEGALSKFPKLVQSHAKAYLSRLAEPKDDILRAIENAGNIVPIWEEIKDSVINELWDEFKAAYGNNRSHPQFTSIIECWTDVEVDVAEFNAQIKVPELAQVSLFSEPKEDGAQVEDGAQALSLGY